MLDLVDGSRGTRRLLLTELADIYIAEQATTGDRPLTEMLPELLDGIRANHVTSDRAIDLFDQFARTRADGNTSRGEFLLDQIVGEAL